MTEDFIVSSGEESWAIAEQRFMRFIGVSLLILAFVSIFFPPYNASIGTQFVRVMNIAITVILGIGSLWSLYWSMDIQRLYKLINDFKEKGNSATYITAGIQALVGLLFSSELLNGNIVLGLLGFIMIASAVFFIWRAQQISHFSRK